MRIQVFGIKASLHKKIQETRDQSHLMDYNLLGKPSKYADVAKAMEVYSVDLD